MKNKYELPDLPYGYKELEPNISEEQLRIHHDKHHKAYVDGANKILERIDDARKKGKEIDMKGTLKELSWQVGGHVLHSLYWENLTGKGGMPENTVKIEITKEFGSFDRFKLEFNDTAKTVEGSGWAALVFCQKTNRLLIMQIEKHNMNIYPSYGIILVMDMFEHAYYIDHKNDKGRYIDAFWKIIDWSIVNSRLENIRGK
jgi:Fe-Mn family superoxide dismutase